MNSIVNHQLTKYKNFTVSGTYDRSLSNTTIDSGIYSDEERCSMSSGDNHEKFYHFVDSVKVVGVHKRETPKVQYLFVIITRWNDKSQVTVYRKWSEINYLKRTVVKAIKRNNSSRSAAPHFIKKTARRVQKVSSLRQRTMKHLHVIDSLNRLFEAMVDFEDARLSDAIRSFFKPSERDLDSKSWSGNGVTYFYVTRDVSGKINSSFNADTDEEEYQGVDCDDKIDPSKHMNEQGTAIQQTTEDFNLALEKYSEADPNISYPIKPQPFVAICDFDASAEDPKDNIISLTEGEEVDVLDKSDCGWWLVIRTKEEPKTSNGLNECGYVPASHLEEQEKEIVITCDSQYMSQ